MTVAQLLANCSSRELSEWVAFTRREAQVQELVTHGKSPLSWEMANEMVWGQTDPTMPE